MNHKTMFHIYTAFTAVVLAGYSTMAFGQVGNNFGVLNPNIATAEELSELSHISSSLAEDIIDNRPFLTMEDFDNLLSESLDEDQRTDLFVHLFVPINLNAASEDEIMLWFPELGNACSTSLRNTVPIRISYSSGVKSENMLTMMKSRGLSSMYLYPLILTLAVKRIFYRYPEWGDVCSMNLKNTALTEI